MTQPLSSNSFKPLSIIDAKEDDIHKIVKIHNSLVVSENSAEKLRGFFLRSIEAESIATYMNRPDRMFLIAEKDGQIAAYLIAKKELEKVDSLHWLDPSAQDLIKEKNHWHVDQVATVDTFARQGCARALYNELVRRSQNGPVSCYIATHPYYNEVSLQFHSRLGFKTVAQFESPFFLGIPDYKSVLLLKK